MIVFGVCDNDTAFAHILAQKIRCISVGLPNDIECDVNIFFSAQQVIDYINSSTLNILLLDIDMPKKNGFELARELHALSPSTLIMFVSAYDRFVFDAFQYTPFCFLRKDHLKEELEDKVLKAIDMLLSDTQVINVMSNEGEVNILNDDIVYIESNRNYYDIHCFNGVEYHCRGTLTSVEKELQSSDFVRIHTAYLINMKNIRSLNGNYQIIMMDGTEFRVSARKWKAFRERFAEFCRKKILLT